MDPRTRRLRADFEQVTALFAGHPQIRVVETKGDPPESYLIEYRVLGLTPVTEEEFREGREHRAQIFLPVDYPRRAPYCRMVTPVFHPNIDPQKICIGDHWSAGQRLAHLIVRIGEMITYQSYNVKSPLNARAAAWAEQNLDRLPLEHVNLAIDL